MLPQDGCSLSLWTGFSFFVPFKSPPRVQLKVSQLAFFFLTIKEKNTIELTEKLQYSAKKTFFFPENLSISCWLDPYHFEDFKVYALSPA